MRREEEDLWEVSPGPVRRAKQTAAEVAVMFPVSRELCHICKTVLRSCSSIYPADEDITGTETCHGKMSTWAFYEVSQDTDIFVFHRRIKPLSWASKEPLQSFQARKQLLLEWSSFNLKAASLRSLSFYVTESRGGPFKVIKLK